MAKDEKSDRIRNRESWLKVIIIAAFGALIAWKIAVSPISISIPDLRLSDLISLVISLFAIALSVAFYLKATETSNTFYDNTYKFTQEVSEILGRIEAGFGERLRHLDEGYAGLRDKFDRIPVDPVKVEKQVKKEEEQVKKKEEERNQLLESLAQKAKLQEHEKQQLFAQLKDREEELNNARHQLAFYKRRLDQAESPSRRQTSSRLGENSSAARYIRTRLLPLLGYDAVLEAPLSLLTNRFEVIKADLPKEFLQDLVELRILDGSFNLTQRGANVLREVARSQ